VAANEGAASPLSLRVSLSRLSSESGEILRHVKCYSAKGEWGSRKARGDAESVRGRRPRPPDETQGRLKGNSAGDPRVCVLYYCRTYYKAVRVGGGGEWRTCAMRDDEPRPVWTSLPITH